MIKNTTLRGYVWAFVAVVAVSNVYIFSKAALNDVHIAQFGFYWFGLGLLWNILFTAKTCKTSIISNLTSNQIGVLITIGILETVGTTLFFYAIHVIENPAVTSFLGNLGPLFVTILGVSILKEKFNNIEIIGMALTIAGAFVISYRGYGRLNEIFIKGTEYVIFASLLFAITKIVIKKNIVKLPPALMSLNRVVFLFVFSTIMMFVLGKSFVIPQSAIINITIGSVLGPFLTVIAGYNALKYIEASRQAMLGSTKSLFVLAGAYLYFNNVPYNYQIIGGILTILGVLLISFGKLRLWRKA